jgi:biopolymer transport protein ExbB
MTVDELMHYLRLGGFTMAIIAAGSLLALAVAIERLIALWQVSDASKALSEVIARHLLRGDLTAARSAAERSPAMAADIFLAAFQRLDRVRTVGSSVEAAVERERAQVSLRLKKNLWMLGTIGATAPFIGLFGTVTGIMRSFRDLGVDVQAGGTGGTAAVMTGISEALIATAAGILVAVEAVATAAGILVAVEAVILYNYFQSRLGRIAVELRLLSDEFVELLRERPANAISISPTTDVEPSAAPLEVRKAVES